MSTPGEVPGGRDPGRGADDRVRLLIADARRRREQHAADRAVFAAARDAGLRRRHAAKLARTRDTDDTTTNQTETMMTDTTQPDDQTPEQHMHEQRAAAFRTQIEQSEQQRAKRHQEALDALTPANAPTPTDAERADLQARLDRLNHLRENDDTDPTDAA